MNAQCCHFSLEVCCICSYICMGVVWRLIGFSYENVEKWNKSNVIYNMYCISHPATPKPAQTSYFGDSWFVFDSKAWKLCFFCLICCQLETEVSGLIFLHFWPDTRGLETRVPKNPTASFWEKPRKKCASLLKFTASFSGLGFHTHITILRFMLTLFIAKWSNLIWLFLFFSHGSFIAI